MNCLYQTRYEVINRSFVWGFHKAGLYTLTKIIKFSFSSEGEKIVKREFHQREVNVNCFLFISNVVILF